ncbi:MAG: hypothetical protein R3320_02910 [Nitriliruptorales bacterium]|nr:hypothetical protein [Nitriliruptorales bacterium]
MTGPRGASDQQDEPSLAALDARLRRRKLRLERLNPVEDFERYHERLLEVVELEARIRDRAAREGP